MYRRRRPVLDPFEIVVVGLHHASAEGRSVGGLYRKRLTVFLLVDLSMAVTESEAVGAAMQVAGTVLPYAALGVHFCGEGPIIDAVRVLINQHP